jgi:hypothetical protein
MAAAAKRKPAEPGAPKRIRGGRSGVPVYTQALADVICDRLADGEPLVRICASPGFPAQSAVRKWALERPDFGVKYARARAIGYELLADEVIAIGDASIYHNGAPDNALVQQARLRSDNRKWMLSKMLPKVYGDKIELSGDANAPLIQRIELVAVRPKLTPPTIDGD